MQISVWLAGLDGGRFATHSAAFEAHFSTCDDVIDVAREIGADSILKEVGITAMTDRVKLKKAIEALLGSVTGSESQHKPTSAPTSCEEDDATIYATGVDESSPFHEWLNETARLDKTAEEINAELATTNTALAAKYFCRVVRTGESTPLLAVVARTESRPLTRQLSAKVWASIRLQVRLPLLPLIASE